VRDDGLLNHLKMVEIANGGDEIFLLGTPVPRIVLGCENPLALKVVQLLSCPTSHESQMMATNNRLNQPCKAVLPDRKLRFENRL